MPQPNLMFLKEHKDAAHDFRELILRPVAQFAS
jgi:hypothetical protein